MMQRHAEERAHDAGLLRDMQDQVRDLMFAVEAQRAVQGADQLEDGDVVKIKKDAVPAPPKTGGGKSKNKKKK